MLRKSSLGAWLRIELAIWFLAGFLAACQPTVVRHPVEDGGPLRRSRTDEQLLGLASLSSDYSSVRLVAIRRLLESGNGSSEWEDLVADALADPSAEVRREARRWVSIHGGRKSLRALATIIRGMESGAAEAEEETCAHLWERLGAAAFEFLPENMRIARGKIVHGGSLKPVIRSAVVAVVDAHPAASATSAARRLRAGVTGDDGGFSFPAPPDSGYLCLLVRVADQWRIARQGMYPMATSCWVQSDHATAFLMPNVWECRVRILTRKGTPVPDAVCHLVGGRLGAPLPPWSFLVPDSDGRLIVRDLDHADLWLDVAARGFVPVRLSVVLWPGADPPRHVQEVRLEEGVATRVRVTDGGGGAIAGAWLEYGPLEKGAEVDEAFAVPYYWRVCADAMSSSTFYLPIADRWLIRGGAPGYRQHARVWEPMKDKRKAVLLQLRRE